ncbi:MAG: small multi-drug export protein [Clostridia bacterium]|nr:small multi-drug export protein [Clostridia bacterium]MBR5448243.1 small multi-drug export protein [Clostridia bacterium]MBR5632999.1 small multi-drug export protein [Clostridia bacterium]
MVPIIELRGALPLAIAAEGLNPVIAYFFCVIGNCLPVPFLILFVRPVFEWMRRTSKWLGNIVDKLEAKAHGKAEKVKKYEMLGLFLFVAIPLPGTGAWTGSLIAAVLGMRVKDSVPMICLGVFAAGILMTLGSGAVRMLIELF